MFLHVGLLITVGIAASPLDAQFAGCQSAQASEITRLLSVELTGRPPPDALSLTIACSPSAIHVRASDPAGTRERALDPAASERTVALAAVELIDALADSADSGPGEPAAAKPVVGARAARRLMLSASAVAGVTHTPSSLTWGGVIGLDIAPMLRLPQLGIHLDVLVEHTERALTPGSANLTLAGAAIALEAHSTGPLWQSGVGAGLRLGPAFISGSSSNAGTTGHTASTLWSGPMLRAGLERNLGDRIVVRLGAEAGLVTRRIGLLVDGSRQASLAGAWILGTLGIGITL